MTAATAGRRRSRLWRTRRWWFALGLVLVVAATGAGYVVANVPLPEAEPTIETTLVFDATGRQLAELSPQNGERRLSVPLEKVAPVMIDAVLAAEDKDFFGHPGVDLSAITRALFADLRGRPIQGGSTITQQYVKQAFVGTERTIVRKMKEATLALKLERKLDKEEILERYLNIVYFGRGAHGVEAAAEVYFGTDAARLDLGQAALLAGLIRSPELADPTTHPEEATGRRRRVLDAMVDLGAISKAERDAAAGLPVAARPRDDALRDRYVDGQLGIEYAVEHARRQLQRLGFGDEVITGGGLRVHTSLDLDLQAAAYRAVYLETLNQPGDPDGALVSLDRDGRVKAMVGGRNWDADVPWARVNFATGVDGGGTGRQAGSSFKPFALAALIDQGYTVDSVFPAPATVVFPGRNNGADYSVSNYEEAAFGQLDVVDATRLSSNTVYAQITDAIGPEAVARMATRLGVSAPVEPFLSVSLGTNVVSVQDMAAGYLPFATRGLRVAPSIIERVTDAKGRELYRHQPEPERVLEEEKADRVTAVLRRVVEAGTGTRAKLATPAAGKTGTTQGNGDAWFVGYTPNLVTAVWMGYPEGQRREMTNVHGIRVTGGSLPAMAWKRFMDTATADPRYRGEFVAPADLHAGVRLVSKLPIAAAGPPEAAKEEEKKPDEPDRGPGGGGKGRGRGDGDGD